MFTDRAKLIALAIVHVFETSKPFGDFSAVAVLDDGAGVSYGINQFTHRSGSLLTVVNTYLGEGGSVGRDMLEWALPQLRDRNPATIKRLSDNARFKDALRAAGRTPEMRLAQTQVMENSYLLPAIEACEGSNFRLPLSLAVIYDSINHGSFPRIRDSVTISRSEYPSDEGFEKAWIKTYTRNRDRWLESVPRLRVTSYRTKFFLLEIGKGNWTLDLPLNVHGVRLTDAMFASNPIAIDLGLGRDLLDDDNPAELLDLGDQLSAAAASNAGTHGDLATTTTEFSAGPSTDTTPAVPQPPIEIPPANIVPNVAVEKEPPPPGFFEGIKLQISTWIASIGGTAGMRQYADDIQNAGVPSGLFRYAIFAVTAAFAAWLCYRGIVHFWTRFVAPRWLTTSLVAANSTPTNLVAVVESGRLAEFEARDGWEVVRRK